MSFRRTLTILAILLIAATAWGQQENSAPDSTAQPKGIEFHVDTPDSVLQASVFMFHLQPFQVKFFSYDNPVFDPTHAQFHNPIDGFNGNYYLYTTEVGHPHIELFRDYSVGLGLNYRPNVFPGFYKTPENITLYQVRKPYTLLAYHSSLKKDYQLHVTHTQNITERWNFALDYHLFSPTGTYANSSATDHLLDLSTNYYSRDARYLMTAGLIMQRMNLGENGGLTTDSIYTRRMVDEDGGIPINEQMLHSMTRDLTIYTHQSFNTVRQFEWYRPVRQNVIDTLVDTTTHTTRYQVRDTIVGYDTIHPHKPHVANTGVFALDVQYDRQQYRYTDSTRYHRLTSRLYWTNDAYTGTSNPFILTLGIRPQADRLELRDSLNTAVTNVQYYPFAKADFLFGKHRNARIGLLGEMGISSGEYNLNATTSFSFGASDQQRTISIQANIGAASPDLIYTLQQAAGGPEIRNIETLHISSEFQGRWVKLFAAANRISNNIWLDKQFRTVQSDSSAMLFQGGLTANIKLFGHLHYDMQQLVQYSGDQDQIRVPLFASKNSLYIDFNMFHGALRSQVGADMLYHTPYKADGYNPALGVFYRQDDVEVGDYILGDIFLNFQIKRASIYIKAGHLNSLFEQRNFCIMPHYPMRGFGLYYGLTWQFFD